MPRRTTIPRPQRVLHTLDAARRALIHNSSDRTRLCEMCRALVEAGRFASASVALAGPSAGDAPRLAARARLEDGEVATTWWPAGQGPEASRLSVRVVASGPTESIRSAAGGTPTAGGRNRADDEAIGHLMAVPIVVDSRTVGSVEVQADRPDAAGDAERSMLEELARDLGCLCHLSAQPAPAIPPRLLNVAIDEVSDGIYLMEGDSPLFRFVNRSAAESLGYSREELTGGMGVLDIDDQATAEMWQQLVPVVRARRRLTIETTHRTRDGRRIPVEVTGNYFESDGQTYNMAIVRDVTERKLAEAALRESEELYRSLVEAMAEGVVVQAADGRATMVNPAAERITGRSAALMVGKPALWEDWGAIREDGSSFPGDEHPAVATLRSGEAQSNVVMGICRPDGAPRWISVNAQPLRRPGETKPHAVVTTFHDLTARREAEATVRAREAEYRTLTEHSPDVIVRVDPEGHYLYGNHMLEVITGSPIAAHVGRRLGEVVGDTQARFGDLAARIQALVAAVCASRTPCETTMAVRLEDVERVFDVRLIPEQDDTGAVASVLIVGRDITEWERAAAALRASEERFRQVTENIDEVFWLRDAVSDGIVYLSPACERVLGSRERLAADPGAWLALVHADDRARVGAARAAQADGGYDLEYRILRGDETRWIHDRAFVVRDEDGQVRRIAGIAEDVTVRRKLEDQLRHSQKMEAVGQLAGGVAHDFNNLLAVIQMQASLLLAVPDDPAVREEGLREILAASERAANLTRQLLTFSRRQVAQAVDLDIAEVVGAMTRLLRRILGEDVTLETHLAPGLPLIHADPGMIEQVLMNLAVNARDAMPGGGRLRVTLEAVTIDAATVAIHPAALPGRFICLTVSDTGCGIPAGSLPHVFEPFFTTKEVGKGTGLGLATVFGIVEQHRGWIDVESRAGEGATFRVFLPALQRAGNSRPPPSPSMAAPQGSETILFVEDEPPVRTIVRSTLERHGYTVLAADSASAARELWRGAPGGIDLLVTDVILPGGVSGRQLADELTAERPALPVIFTTGYSADLVDQPASGQPARLVLRKPFTASDLARAVRQSLDEGSRPD